MSARRIKHTDKASNGQYTASPEEEEEDCMDDSELEALLQQPDTKAQHRLFIVHPDVKWGSRKQHLTTGETDSRSVRKFQLVTL